MAARRSSGFNFLSRVSHEEKHCKGSGVLLQVEGKSGEVLKDNLARCSLQTVYNGRKWLSNDLWVCPYDFDILFILNLKETSKLLMSRHFNICNLINLFGNILYTPLFVEVFVCAGVGVRVL